MSSDLFKRNEVATVAGMAGHLRQCGRARFFAADRRPGGYDRVFAVFYLPGRAGRHWRDHSVDRGARSTGCGELMKIQNPILRGFNPDPSIVRVGDDYYIATSTFEWYPGVQIHHSRDLVHWRLLTRPLRRASQLNMLGRSRFLRHLGAMPELCRRAFLSDLHRRQTVWPTITERIRRRLAPGFSQLPCHQLKHRRRLVRSGVFEQRWFRSVALS